MAKKQLTAIPFLWADVIRIVAIVLVVQIHSLADVGIYIWQANIIVKLSVVCVPLFVLLSGSLLLGKTEDYQTFFKKRILKVFIPWIFWIIIYIYFDIVFLKQQQTLKFLHDGNAFFFYTWLKIFIVAFLSRLWFLPLIFGLYILTPITRILVQHAKKIDIVFYFILWFLFASVLPFVFHNALFPVYEPNLLLAPFQYIGLFLLGHYIIRIKSHRFLSILAIIMVICLSLQFLPVDNYFLKTFAFSYVDPGSFIAATILFLLLYNLSELIQKYLSQRTKNIIHIVSQASFGVYLIHELLYYFLVHTLFISFIKYPYGLTLPVIVFLCSTLIVFFLRKLPIVKYVLP